MNEEDMDTPVQQEEAIERFVRMASDATMRETERIMARHAELSKMAEEGEWRA